MTKVHHLIVLDASGSMSCITRQTIDGCNETIQTIRTMQKDNADTQEHYVSINLFEGRQNHYMIEDKPIADVNEITGRDYQTGGSTPLYDAMGDTLTALREKLVDGETMAYVTIITDGEENSSRRYSYEQVVALIDELKKRDVIFTFIGANIDAGSYARALHISNALQFEQTEEGTRRMWERERRSKRRSSLRQGMFAKIYGSADATRMVSEEDNQGDYYFDSSAAANGRVTPRHISKLKRGEIFVFGSNTQGAHAGGAARAAVDHFGAIWGQAEGLQGQTYAIPTVGLDLRGIYEAVERFIKFAKAHPELKFLVTPIGCGIAGFRAEEIAPMFRYALNVPNIHLPEMFWKYL